MKSVYCGPSSVTVKYSDEAQERVIHDYVDYVYTSDIRVEGSMLYVFVEGWGAGIWRYTKLYVYDLAARKTLHKLKIDEKDLK